MGFIEADRGEVFVKAVLAGTPGTGKTYTALKLASLLAAHSEGIDLLRVGESELSFPRVLARSVAVIESENRAREYAGGKPFHYSAEELVDYGPEQWSRALDEARRAGFKAVILDSMSDEWRGRGGCLQLVESKGGAFNAWAEVKRAHWALIEQIQNYPGHVLITVRSKAGIEIVEDPNSKRKVPVRTAPSPIQEDEFPYRFSHYWEMVYDDHEKSPTLVVSKSVAPNVPIGCAYARPGLDFAKLLIDWCASEGAQPSEFKISQSLLRDARSREDVGSISKGIAANLGAYTIREIASLRELAQSRIASFLKVEAANV